MNSELYLDEGEGDFKTGDILFEKYIVVKLIGRGAFGEIYLVSHTSLKFYQAIKILRRNSNDIGSSVISRYRERFRLEAKLGADLNHPNIIRVHNFEEQDGVLALIMDYADGGSLAQKIQTLHSKNAFLPVLEFLKIATDISGGLAELHRCGIIHRDLKPGNILLNRNGNALIGDLGVAQTLDGATTRSHVGEDIPKHPGTPVYMSPEQESSYGYLKPPSDVYSLGLIFFEMLTGKNYKNLKTGTHVRNVRKDVPPKLDKLINKMLKKNPEERPWNGEAVFSELKDISSPNLYRRLVVGTGFVVGLAILIIALRSLVFPPDLHQPTPSDTPEIVSETETSAAIITTPISPSRTLPINTETLTPFSPTIVETIVTIESSKPVYPTITITPKAIKANIIVTRAWLRKGPALDHPIIEELKQDDKVTIEFRTLGDWFLVRTEKGNEGWLYIAWLNDFSKESVPFAETTPTSMPPSPTSKPQPPIATVYP